MALSPLFPPNLFTSSSSSYSLSFLIPQARTQSSNTFRTQKLETSCSYQKIEVESEIPQRIKVTSTIPKKKRKLRPSFYEQVRERWSLKNPSQRLKFPWQEQEGEEEEEDEGDEEEKEEEEKKENGKATLLDNPVNFELGNRVAAPWVQKSKPRKTHFTSETKITQSNGFEDEEVREVREKLKEPERVVNSNRNSEEKQRIGGFVGSVVENGASSIGIAEERLMKLGEDFNGVSLAEKHSGSDKGVVNFVGFGDGSDSVRFPLEKERGLEYLKRDRWRKNNTEVAEKLIPEGELRRIRNVALRMKERIKVGAAGITQPLVDCIHEKWKVDEVVKLKFEGAPSMNMKRIHDVLERRTGGLVIWRSGSSLVLFRGMSYKLPCVQSYTKHSQANPYSITPFNDSALDVARNVVVSDSDKTTVASVNYSLKSPTDQSEAELMEISELDNLLDELGPRFTDWSGCDPLPVDADLLPSLVPNYMRPFRLLPHGVRYCLNNKEMTTFRRLARRMRPHFALGRNRELQGLAMAMVKLWERSAITKIAIKRGVLNTNNERMAEELKNLTGGTLVSRNKDYIVFYRGKDFLPPDVTAALQERQKLANLRQDEEEKARQRASSFIVSNFKTPKGPLVAGTLVETLAADSRWANQPSSKEMEKMKRDLDLAKHAALVRYLEKKLVLAQEKVKRAERALGKVQEYLKPADLPTDLETITDEERFLFRKMGLSMKPFLPLGKRGIFDGTVENIHLHWKYRELVKLIVKGGKSFLQVKHLAISLEAESGGLLISLDKTTKGYVIVLYRGKNYQSPNVIKPKNLLTKRQALARSIELQRREALKHHISSLVERIEMMKSELYQMEAAEKKGDYYSKLNDAYYHEDEIEEEGEEAYLETYPSGDENQDTHDEEAQLKQN